MPYVKSIPVHTTVSKSIAYILNPKKTDGLLYTASLNCMTNAKDAYLAMKSVYEHYSGEKFNAPLPIEGKGRVKAIHYVQSFDPKDNVSPELAHRIAKAFARYISVKAEGQQRAVRLKTLGEDYTPESLTSRILWKDAGTNFSHDDKPSPIRDDYIRTIMEITGLARKGQKVKRKRDRSSPYSPDNDMDVYKLSAQLSIINRDGIQSISELEGKIEKLKAEYENARRELNSLIVKQDKLEGLAEQADIYFSLSDKAALSPSEQLKLNICRQAMENNNIHSREDYDRLNLLQKETGKKIAVLKNSFENCKQLYEIYADIAKTYYDISKGDYISKLVEEEQRKRKKERDKKKSL